MTTTPKTRPIILHPEEVRAILDGRLTMLWRPLKRQPPSTTSNGTPYTGFQRTTLPCAEGFDLTANMDNPKYIGPCPFGDVGTLLWGRETWGLELTGDWGGMTTGSCLTGEAALLRADKVPMRVIYRADGEQLRVVWRPSSHMPFWASRPELRNLGVAKIGVRPVQSITDAEVIAAGVEQRHVDKNLKWFRVNDCHGIAFSEFWDRHNKRPEHQWDANPVAWVVTFKEVKT